MEEEWINRQLQDKKLSRKECYKVNNISWANKLESEIKALRERLHDIQKEKRLAKLKVKKRPCTAVTGQELR